MSVVFFILASLALAAILWLTMKTAELSAAVDDLALATDNLSASVDAAIAVLMNSGAVTPDSDIVPLIERLSEKTGALQTLKAKLDAALTPPQP